MSSGQPRLSDYEYSAEIQNENRRPLREPGLGTTVLGEC